MCLEKALAQSQMDEKLRTVRIDSREDDAHDSEEFRVHLSFPGLASSVDRHSLGWIHLYA
jgi:hypothetical protein